MFQFQTGSIKSALRRDVLQCSNAYWFQFQTGSIKRPRMQETDQLHI